MVADNVIVVYYLTEISLETIYQYFLNGMKFAHLSENCQNLLKPQLSCF